MFEYLESLCILIVLACSSNADECRINNGIWDLNACETRPESNNHERTLILLKPDSVERKIVGKIMERFENKGFNLVGMKMLLATEEMAKDHYIEHAERSFFGSLTHYMTSRPLIAMVWEGANVIAITRNMLGVHDPITAIPGTIRGDFSINIQSNVIHGSDTVESANREINIWFKDGEVIKSK